MAKLTYELKNNFFTVRDINKITFDIPDDLDIHEFKYVCSKLAAAMGYQPNSIKRAFGSFDETIKKRSFGFEEFLSDLGINLPSGSVENGND